MNDAVKAVLTSLLEGVSRKDLERRSQKLSAAYRAGGTSAEIADRMDGLAYLVARFPATYAAAHAAFLRTAEALGEFSPASLLDVGAGPGTAALAAAAVWPSLREVTLLEPNPTFRDFAAKLCPTAKIIAGGLGAKTLPADLVTACYVLAECDFIQAPHMARELWALTRQMLVLVEPGTPQGFERLKLAREALIADDAHVAAPCSHDKPCPLQGGDWCHFSERLSRSRDHRMAKGAEVPFEDERYAYLALSRLPVGERPARIVKPVMMEKPRLVFQLCDEAGLHAQAVARRDKALFRIARKKRWGDLF